MQTKKGTIAEISLNTGSGFVVSLAVTTALQAAGFLATMSPLAITCIYTVTSLVRSYVWRRVFNKKTLKKRVDKAKEIC